MREYSCEEIIAIIRSYSNERDAQRQLFSKFIDRTIDCVELPTQLGDMISVIDGSSFYNCKELSLISIPDGITCIGGSAFACCYKLALTSLPEKLTQIGQYAFQSCSGLTRITFKGTPNEIDSTAFSYCTNLTTINVPWAEGTVANAPWGATNATINYNYVEE